MSVITGVMLICELSGWEDRPSDEVCQIIAWLAERGRGWSLNEVSDHAGGGKHPQFETWSGGLNHFSQQEDEFAAFVLSRDWHHPETVVLILQPEEGSARVFRPSFQPPAIDPVQSDGEDQPFVAKLLAITSLPGGDGMVRVNAADLHRVLTRLTSLSAPVEKD